jgi:hypothetical protein
MAITASSPFRSSPQVTTGIDGRNGSPISRPSGTPVSASFDPVALIRNVSARMVRSADPEVVLGSMVTAYAENSSTRCTVELLSGATVRVLQAPAADCDPAGAEQPSLSPEARQLLAGDGEPLAGAD